MSSEKLGSAKDQLKGNLGGSWDILEGCDGNYTDLGIARRFGGSAAAYSLRDIGAMNGRVVKVRRDVDGQGTDPEEDFSANQVQSGALEDWVNGKLETTLPADVATAAAAFSLRKVKASYSGNAVRIRRSSDDAEVNVAFDSDGKVSTNSSISVVSGTVSDTTLGDFISGTDAFVHTWYDQAGSNDAVQGTAANQPKIAENGALLADGVDFDGSGDFLESTGLASIYTGTDTASSAFIVVNSDVATTTQYIIGAGNTGLSNPMYNTLFHSGGNIGWQARDTSGTLKSNLSATPYVADTMYLVSNINSGTTTDFNSNAVVVDDGADSDVGDKTINTVKLGARGNASSSPLNGSIKEAIFYATDQSGNRFKIESNINNYYGLYNEANSLEGTQFTASSGTTTNNSTNGFTNTFSAVQNFIGIELKEKVPNGEKLYISFNIEQSGYSETTIVHLRKTSITGTGVSNTPTVGNNGFHSLTLTSSDNDAKFLTFYVREDDATITVSNLKVSRIARNGFVETLYDQSSNGNDVAQTTATKQPALVKNGGQVKVGDEASIRFDGNDDFLDRGTYTQGTLSQPNTAFALAQLRVFVDDNQKIFDSSSAGFRNMLNLSPNGNGQFAAFAGTVVATGEDADANQNLFTVRYSGSDSRIVINGVTKTTSSLGTGGMIGITIGANHDTAQNFWDGDIQEVIIFNSDIFDDRAALQDDINNYYTIY